MSIAQLEREKMASTVDNIYNKLKSSSNYSGLSDDLLYDIANQLSQAGRYLSIDAIFSSQIDPLSPFYGENAIWAKFTYTEIIQMEEQGVLIPNEVLSWAHSMQDSDTTDYQTTDSLNSDDPDNIQQEIDSQGDDSSSIDLSKTAKALTEQCEDNQNDLDSQIDNINTMKKDVETQKNQTEEIQKQSLNKIQDIIDEWQALESKLKRNIPLSQEEQERFSELSSLLNKENQQYQKAMDNIDLNFDDIENSLNEIDKTTKTANELSNATESIGEKISQNETKHKFTNTSTTGGNYTGMVGIVMSSSIAQTLAETALGTSITTDQTTQDIQTDVNEIASMVELSKQVTGKAQTRSQTQPAISEEETQNTENEMIEGAENEFKNEENAGKDSTAQTTPTATSSQPAPQAETSAASTGNAGITETTNVSETTTQDSVENDTLGADNSEESGNDLKTQTQEQINKCNTRSTEITTAVNEIEPIRQAVEKIQNESQIEQKIFDAKISKSLKEYETICNKMKSGEQLSDKEQTNFKKLSEDLDKQNGNYVKGLDEKINTLTGYSSSLNYAMGIVNQSFEIANATIAKGKELAISELGDKSYLTKTFYFSLLDDERQKDLLYGKVGESLGREAIQRGDVLNLEATEANTSLSRQIPLSNFATEHATEITNTKNSFVEKVTAITKDVPGAELENDNSVATSKKTSSENSEQLNADNGEAAADEVEKEADGVSGDTKSSKKDAQDMEQTDKAAQKSDKMLQKDSKTIEKNIKKNQKDLEKNEKDVQETQQKIEEETAAVDALQLELDTLNSENENSNGVENNTNPTDNEPNAMHAGFNAMDAMMASGNGQNVNNNQAQIETINSQIDQKTNIINSYSKKITKIQKSSDKIVKSMNLNTKNYNKVVQQEQQEKLEDQSKSEKVLEVATKFEDISSKVAMAGFIVGTTGDLLQLVILPPWIPAIGAVMSAVGGVAETIGNYGVAAANVTKMATYAAQGNLMGALMSAGMAVMAGASAVSSTGQAMKGLQNMGKNIAATQARAAAYQAAKQTATDVTKSTLERVVAKNTTDMMKKTGKRLAKETLKKAGKKSLMYAGTAMAMAAQNKNNTEEEQKSNYNIVLSDKFKSIQRKNQKRREWAAVILNRVASENNEEMLENEEENNSQIVKKTTQNVTAKSGASKNSKSTSSNTSSNASTQELNASNGKAAADNVDKEADGVSSDTKSTQKDAQDMEETDKEAQKSDKTLQKDSKTLEKDIKKNQKDLEKNEKEVEETQQKIEEEIAAVDSMQMELDVLNAENENSNTTENTAANTNNTQSGNDPNTDPMAMHAGFNVMNTVMASGNAQSSGTTNNNQAQIETLTSQIDQKTTVINLYSKKIVKTQKTSDKIVKSMNINTKKFNKAVQKEQKEKQEDQSKAEKVLDVATKIENVSSKVAMAGFIVGTTGDLLQLVILPPWIPAIGAVMSAVGGVAETIGNYGVAAANVTKMATYAAQGNLMGALMSAGMAVMAGASAVSSTGQAMKGLQNMGKNIAATQARAAAYQAAKQTATDVTKSTLERVVAKNTTDMMKKTGKRLAKETLKKAGKKSLMYAGTAVATAVQNKNDQPENEEKQSNYNIILSDGFKEIQRKNKKRRQYVNQRYGIA